MISIDVSRALPRINEHKITVETEVRNAFTQVVDKSGKGNEWLGWREILRQPNDALIADIEQYAQHIRENADIFIVCGIGGSYLGAKAMIDALRSSFDNSPEIIYTGNSIGGKQLSELIGYLEERQRKSDVSVYLNVISKSGTTLETALAFRFIRDWMEKTYGDKTSSRIACTTSAEGGALNKLIATNGYKKYVLPNDVGGRYSVLTPVGLLPIAVAGIDIRNFYYGAVQAFQTFEKDPEAVISYVNARYSLYKTGLTVDAFTVFEPHMKSMGEWFQQLFGESEGKEKKGLFPTVLSYSTDLHSVGQFVQDGSPTLFETFLVETEGSSSIVVPNDAENTDGLNYLVGKSVWEINRKAFEGTRQAHTYGGVSSLTLEVKKFDAETIGGLVYFFELSCAVYCYALGVNPFDQPGVEDYKKAMYSLLGK